MPTRPPRNCKRPGCYGLAHTGDYCEEHRRQPSERAPDNRPPSNKRGYDATWSKLRTMMLAREPLCRHCKKRGLVTAAAMVDHIIPLRYGGARLDPDNLQSLCWKCHARKSAADRARYAGGGDE